MIKKIKHLIKTKPKTVYIILDIPMFVVTFAFIVMTGHALDPEPLALFNSGLGIFTVFSTIGLALQTVVARRIAAAEKIVGARDFLIAALLVGILNIAPFMLPTTLFPDLKSVDVTGVWPYILILSSHVGISFCRGILQGTERFYGLWSAQAVEHVFRIIILYSYMETIVTLNEAWVVVVGASFTHLIYALFLMPKELWQDVWKQTEAQTGLSKEIFSVVMSNFFLTYLLSIDMIVAGENLGDAGGAYVTANKFGKILYFVGASVAIVILPAFARAKSTPKIRKQILMGTFAFVPVAALLSPLGSWMLDPFIRFSFPENIVPSFELLSWTWFSNFALCAIQLFVTWHIAQRTRGLSWLLGACCIILGVLLSSEGLDGNEIIIRTAGVVWITTIVLGILAYLNNSDSREESTEPENTKDSGTEQDDETLNATENEEPHAT